MNKPYKIYAEVLEATALEQFMSAMELDCVVKGALMPDAHTGYSLPIGAAIATKGTIFPSWVGYDIGCGMCAIPTQFNKADVIQNAKHIYREIMYRVPVGFNAHKEDQIQATTLDPNNLTGIGEVAFKGRGGFRQLGTLGGGNHFIEVGADSDGMVWIVIHSGSRGVGHGIAQQYMKLASPNGKASEGHYGFYDDSELGLYYINDLEWALQFALDNRKLMITNVIAAIQNVLKTSDDGHWDQLINRNHNHAEHRNGLWIHRKGATHAELGMEGVIPGNMRDGSFIVKGKGNPDSLYSSSHGAGRVLGRKEAKRVLNFDEFRDTMDGIVGTVSKATLDEAPAAYKNIFDVMDAQKDLVDIVAHVKPMINIKGG